MKKILGKFTWARFFFKMWFTEMNKHSLIPSFYIWTKTGEWLLFPPLSIWLSQTLMSSQTLDCADWNTSAFLTTWIMPLCYMNIQFWSTFGETCNINPFSGKNIDSKQRRSICNVQMWDMGKGRSFRGSVHIRESKTCMQLSIIPDSCICFHFLSPWCIMIAHSCIFWG